MTTHEYDTVERVIAKKAHATRAVFRADSNDE
jgi:hypothetical protein